MEQKKNFSPSFQCMTDINEKYFFVSLYETLQEMTIKKKFNFFFNLVTNNEAKL